MEIFKPEDVAAEEPENMPGVKIRWVIDQKRGAVMWVAPYERHQIKNTGPSTMKFICCVPQKKP